MRIPRVKPTKFEAIGITLCLLALLFVIAHQFDVKANPIKHGHINLMNHNIQFLCFDQALVIDEYKGFTYTNEDRTELERVVSFTCPVKANQRPWIQRMIGMAGHFHFVGLDDNKAWQLLVVRTGFDQSVDMRGQGGLLTERNDILAHIATCDLDFNVIEGLF